jgi:DNA-binding response OmpR family regulator
MAATPPARRVLVIDDEPGIRSFTGRALSSAGFAVTEAASGHKGLQAALSGPHDLVLLDLALPDLGGEEVLRRLQQQRPDLAVLVWSATTEPNAERRSLALGACAYLQKPISMKELISRVAACLR